MDEADDSSFDSESIVDEPLPFLIASADVDDQPINKLDKFWARAKKTMEEGFSAFLHANQTTLENSTTHEKFIYFSAVWGAHDDAWGALDIATLGILRGLFYLSGRLGKWLFPSRNTNELSFSPIGNKITVSEVIRGILSGFYFQRLVGYLLTVISLPLIGLIDYLYPYAGRYGYTPEAEIHDNLLLGKKRRQAFRQFIFNPSTWIIGFLLTFGISLAIQAFNSAVFAEAVMPLTIIQMVFTSMTSLMLVGVVLFAAYWTVSAIFQRSKPHESSPFTQDTDLQNYVKEFFSHKWLASMSITIGALCVLAVVILTAGFLTNGFGVFPGSFDFMAAVFNVIGGGFTASMQNISHLPGLTSIGSISEPIFQLIGQIATVSILTLAAIFVPDAIRRLVQARLSKVVVLTIINEAKGNLDRKELAYQPGDEFQIDGRPSTEGWIHATNLKTGTVGFIHIADTNYFEVTGAYRQKQQAEDGLDSTMRGTPFHCTHITVLKYGRDMQTVYDAGELLEFLGRSAEGGYRMRKMTGEEVCVLDCNADHIKLVVDSKYNAEVQYIVYKEKKWHIRGNYSE